MRKLKLDQLEVAARAIAAAMIGYQIFVPPLIGLAESWDFERFRQGRGRAQVSTQNKEKYFFYFNSKYRITPKPGTPDWYLSSTSSLIESARWTSIGLDQDQTFDIRMLSALHTLIFLFGFWLILASTRSFRLRPRIILCALLIIIFTDVGYVSYVNSFYSEGTAYVFLAVGIGCYLILVSQRASSLLLLIGYFFMMGLVVTSKPQYIPLAPAFAVIGVSIARYI